MDLSIFVYVLLLLVLLLSQPNVDRLLVDTPLLPFNDLR